MNPADTVGLVLSKRSDTMRRQARKRYLQVVEEIGGPGRDRTDGLFHAMEARSQLRHRPTGGERRTFQFSRRQASSSINLQNWNISRRSPEMLLREFKLAKPQFHWINLKMET